MRANAEFRAAFSTTKESLDRIFSRQARLEHTVRKLIRQTVHWVQRLADNPARLYWPETLRAGQMN